MRKDKSGQINAIPTFIKQTNSRDIYLLGFGQCCTFHKVAGKHQISNSKKLRNTAATTEYFLSPRVTNFNSLLATDFRVNSVLGGFLYVILRLLTMPNICGG